ncbi:acetoacetate decarboxylase family protein [Nonomuraea sp. K274]|uniref:Acetoacetate decarboxylase family protein n=1 Tax=Nonomuraea cypriaca TaxID=1187855 RepID=A0A931EZZ3_9ACTN|nr:acetoacetate decarboxylase family protein [Nonomuraea cypriaca]MBF8186651.1 acetoacetate decarboxylase family protein [Nonomuraea cypriaca]
MASHLIQGRTVGMPVRVRDAEVGGACYPVRADAARAVIAYSGLDVAEILPGKAVCALLFVDYRDGDLDAYHEFGMGFLVRPPGASGCARPADLRQAGFFVHWLPVDQAFTLEAGRFLWGFPKELADIELRLGSPYKRCVLRKDGRLVLDMLIKPGVPVPGATLMAPPDAYTHRDGVTRRVPWSVRVRGARMRAGGALIRLGNHPIAKELSELGLPRRAMFSTTASHAELLIGAAREA